MKILHVLGDSAFGGGSRVVLRLCEAAREHGHEPAVLTTDVTFQQFLSDARVPVVDLDCIRRPISPWQDWRGERRLHRYLTQHPVDLVHTHTSKAGVIGRRAAWRARVPAVMHTVHGFAFHEGSHPLTIRVYAALEKMAARWCHRMVTVSRFHRSWALDLGIADPRKLMAIPNGITAAPPRSDVGVHELRREFGLNDHDLMLVSAGRLAPGKGLEELLVALRALRDRPWRLVLPGTGPLADSLPAVCARRGLSDRVVFPGFRDDIRQLLNAADLAVLPTHREGLSIALLEAMAAGLPIVTTTIGSNREVTREGQAALLVSPGNSEQLSGAIATLLDDPEQRARLGVTAREIFLSEYTEATMLQAYIDLYAELSPGA